MSHTSDLETAATGIAANVADIATNGAAILSCEGRLDLVEPVVAQSVTDITGLETLTADHTATLDIMGTTIATHGTLLSTHTDVLLGKQPTISSTARLDMAYVANGIVSNASLNTLSDIKTTSTVQGQIDSLTATVMAIDGLQDLDVLSIPLYNRMWLL